MSQKSIEATCSTPSPATPPHPTPPTSFLCRPSYLTLPLCRKTLLVDDLDPADQASRAELVALLADAADRGDNVGTDEFTPEELDLLLEYLDVLLTFRCPSTRRLQAVVIVVACPYTRSAHPTVCSLLIVTSVDLAGRLAWRDLTRLGIQLARETGTICGHGAGYTAGIVNVFVSCVERMLALREEGFVITGCVPDAGLVAGQSKHVDSYIMYKEFQAANLPLPLPVDNEDSTDEPFNLDAVNLPCVAYLPIEHTLSDGTKILIRSLRRDEIKFYFKALQEAAAAGLGYGVDELPSLPYFARWYVDGFFNLVFELVADNDVRSASASPDSAAASSPASSSIIGYCNFGPSLFSRSALHPVVSDGNIVIRSEYRQRRWATEFMRVHTGIGFDAGFRCLFGETAATNVASVMAMRRLGVNLCGSVPRGIYFSDVGWTDLILLYMRYDDSISLLKRKMSAKM